MGVLSFLSKQFRYVNERGGEIVFIYPNGYIINKPSGIDTVSIRLSQATGINQVGATVQSRSIQPRAVTVSGRLVGPWQSVNKDNLLSVVRPDLRAKFYADDFYLDVYPTATPTVEPRKSAAAFQFSLLAAYPYWQNGKGTRSVLSGLAYRFKFPWNISREYTFGEVMASQFINVYNRGQLPVPFTVTFNALGPCVNPRITNIYTGQFLAIEKALVGGERVVVEITHDRTYVTSSIDGDVRGALSLDSSLTRLEVGDNVLKPEADEGMEDLMVSMDFATETIGITL